jgi:ABC-type branched-subunit amino acid transport system ATPase component
MLRLRGVRVRFGGVVPLDGLDFDVPERGMFLVVGPNGAGKTTMLNVLSRVVRPESGSMMLGDVDLLTLAPSAVIRAGVGRSFQRAELFGGLSARENVLVGLHHLRLREAEARKRADAMLARLGLAQVAHTRAAALPHGTQKTVDLARALVSEPRLLLLDEPFAGITHAEIPAMVAAIAEAAQRCAVVMVEHHLEVVMHLAERVTVLDFGRKISEGTAEHVRNDPAVIRSYLGGKAVEHAW